MKPHILIYSNGLAIWHSFHDITHIKVNNCLKSIILNLIVIFQGISLPETTQSFCFLLNVWVCHISGLLKLIMAESRPFWIWSN